MFSSFRHLLGSPRMLIAAPLVAVVLASTGLGGGLQNDDLILEMALSRPPVAPEWERTPFNAFVLMPGDREVVRRAVDWGVLPWWTQEDLRIAFFRPLTGLTHWLDFRVWPTRPWLMHLHSLLWFGAAVAAAAFLYRRLLGPTWVAGLAALLFAVDDAHGWPAVWIANRNACIAVAFGLLAIAAYDRARRHGRRFDLAAPLLLLLSLLGGELALGVPAYLFAYALFLDRDRPWNRVLSLVPCAVVTLAWALAYRSLGYGVVGSPVYIDPSAQPLAFAGAVIARAPMLLFGQWLLPSELSLLLSGPARWWVWAAGCAVAALMALLLAPLIRRHTVSRFFATGAALSLLPACSTFPADRLLFLVGFGAMGLLAQWFGAVGERAVWLPSSGRGRFAVRAAVTGLVAVHLVLAPLQLLLAGPDFKWLGTVVDRSATSFSAAVTGREARVLVVNTPTVWLTAYGPLQMTRERRRPPMLLTLGSGIYPIELRRTEPRVLVVRPALGFAPPQGAVPAGRSEQAPPFSPRYAFMMFDRLFREKPIPMGMRVALTDVEVEVTEVTPDGRAAAARYRFDRPLDDPAYRWLQWIDGEYRAFTVPAVGDSVTLSAVRIE